MAPKDLKLTIPGDTEISYDDGAYQLALDPIPTGATLVMLLNAGYKYLLSTASGNAGADTLAKKTDGELASLATRVGYLGDIHDAKAFSAHAIPALRAERAAKILAGDTSFSVARGARGPTVESIMRQLAKTMVENAYKAQVGKLPPAPAKGKTHPVIAQLIDDAVRVHASALRAQAETQLKLLASMGQLNVGAEAEGERDAA